MHKRDTGYLGVPPNKISMKPKEKPIMIQSVSSIRLDGYPPLFIQLEENCIILYNCMIDSSAEVNVIPIRVMEKLELDVTSSFGSVCGIDSRLVEVIGVIENL